MTENVDLLEELLSAASEELENSSKNGRSLHDINLFECDNNLTKTPNKKIKNSLIHDGETDSSDDEDNRNCQNQKYNECGREVKHLLGTPQTPYSSGNTKHRSSVWKNKPALSPQDSSLKKNPKINELDVSYDPVFGIRIINPLISSAVLQERMLGREAVCLSRISRYLQFKKQDTDWVIAGVVVGKSAVKTSQKGNQYSIWTLSDLKDDIKTLALFLFGNAHHQLWKTVIGTVVGVLNPSVLDRREGSKDEASLSVDNSQKVMIMGQSKDYGTCKSMKKNGEKCSAIVNKSRCEFCLYHIKQEYQKCSKRSELQANFSGRGLTALRNKVLGKNEVFYAGKSYMAIPTKKSKKLELNDMNRLQSLNNKMNGISPSSNNIVKAKTKSVPKNKQNAARLDVTLAQRLRDIELLKKLGVATDLESKNNFAGVRSSDITLEESRSTAISVINKLKAKNEKSEMSQSTTHPENKNSREKNISDLTNSCKLESDDKDLSSTSDSSVIQSCSPRGNGRLGVDQVEKHSKLELTGKDCTNSEKKANDKLTSDKILVDKTRNCSLSSSSLDRDTISKAISSTKLALSQDNFESIKSSSSIGLSFPKLSSPGRGNVIDLSKPIIPRNTQRAKLNAIKLIQKNGPLKKVDPNNHKKSGTKRVMIDDLEINCHAKKSKLAESEFISDRFKKMMAATSSHMDLLEARDEEEQEKYFKKLEAKEQMEEKMTNTFKIACKAVRCLVCKYTSFSASDMCKSEKHPLKVFDAMKRFFKCGNCSNRTVSLEIIPTVPCKNCGSGKWERTGMMKEKVAVATHVLSIRGGDQKFVNSVATDTNINLLVPDTD